MLQKIKNLIYAIHEIKNHSKNINEIKIDNYIKEHLFKNPKYYDDKKLNKYEFQVYSQNGEDGILEEIFNRIGVKNNYFVEFGIQNGLECNTSYLLLKGWSGLWLEGDKKCVAQAATIFKDLLRENKLKIQEAFITAENIESLFHKFNVPQEFDLLSIDIDGNDYYVWEAITYFTPRAVVIEYNAIIRPNLAWVKAYNPTEMWNDTSYFGAGLKSLEILANKKGYCLVGCDFSGTNAFFVRQDLIGEQFLAPYTAENHYEPVKYFLNRNNGHPRGFGKFNTIK